MRAMEKWGPKNRGVKAVCNRQLPLDGPGRGISGGEVNILVYRLGESPIVPQWCIWSIGHIG